MSSLYTAMADGVGAQSSQPTSWHFPRSSTNLYSTLSYCPSEPLSTNATGPSVPPASHYLESATKRSYHSAFPLQSQTMTVPASVPSAAPDFFDVQAAELVADATASPSSGGEGEGEGAETEPSTRSTGRPKSHGCWMCHKSFDRPSTLRKHLLVHTGEKAYACDICGRRFGIASNLNRHTRRCALRPVNTTRAERTAAPAPATSSSGSEPVTPTTEQPAHEDSSSAASTSRGTLEIPAATGTSSASASSSTSKGPVIPTGSQPPPKAARRKRRAPSPSVWVPSSLRGFNLSPCKKSAPVPLPPARPSWDGVFWEERDSFDKNISANPYHPDGWSGKLPGPALITNDISNNRGAYFTYQFVF